jgi:hypothetical protein
MLFRKRSQQHPQLSRKEKPMLFQPVLFVIMCVVYAAVLFFLIPRGIKAIFSVELAFISPEKNEADRMFGYDLFGYESIITFVLYIIFNTLLFDSSFMFFCGYKEFIIVSVITLIKVIHSIHSWVMYERTLKKLRSTRSS